MKEYKDTNIIEYEKEEFLPIFNKIKDCIRFDRFTIELNDNRLENRKFIDNYNLTHIKIKKILTDIKIEDFCYASRHKDDYNVLLYIFAPKVNVYEADGDSVSIDMYIKFRIYDLQKPAMVVAISFHKLNYSVNYLYK